MLPSSFPFASLPFFYTNLSKSEKFAKVRARPDTDDEHSVEVRPLRTNRFPGGETVRRRPSDGSPGLLHFLRP